MGNRQMSSVLAADHGVNLGAAWKGREALDREMGKRRWRNSCQVPSHRSDLPNVVPTVSQGTVL
jgi:hypothetical protein